MNTAHLQEAIEILLNDAKYQDQQTIIWNILTDNFQQIIDEIEEKGRAEGRDYGFEAGFEKGYEEGKQYGIMLAD